MRPAASQKLLQFEGQYLKSTSIRSTIEAPSQVSLKLLTHAELRSGVSQGHADKHHWSFKQEGKNKRVEIMGDICLTEVK